MKYPSLAGKRTPDTMACVNFQHITADQTMNRPSLTNRKRNGRDIIGRTEMGTDAATLGTKLFHLALGQEPAEASCDGPRVDG